MLQSWEVQKAAEHTGLAGCGVTKAGGRCRSARGSLGMRNPK